MGKNNTPQGDEESGLIPLQALRTLHRLKPKQDIGEPGELAMIPVEWLYVDREYQRPILHRGAQNIIQIVEHFDWKYFTPLTVRKRGPKIYSVPDGQHRGVAAITHGGIKLVPCYVTHAKTQAEEAEIFAVANGRRTNVSSLQIHIAGRVAGEERAVKIQKVCLAAGARICRYPVPALQMKPGQTLAVATIGRAIKVYGEDVVILAMKCVTKTGNGNAGLLNEMTIGGGAQALSQHTNLLRPQMQARVLHVINKVGVNEIYIRARQRRLLDGGMAISNYALEMRVVFEKAGLTNKTVATHDTRFKLS